MKTREKTHNSKFHIADPQVIQYLTYLGQSNVKLKIVKPYTFFFFYYHPIL